jgi:prenyltransferase beta subunit
MRQLLCVAITAFACSTTYAQSSREANTAEPLTELKVVQRVTAATDRAVAYIASKQRPDGGWHNNQAVNALALLSLMGRGHVPGRGPYRDVLERGKRFVLATAQPTGYLAFNSMYEHGLATLALAEMYGMDPDPDLEEKLRKAVDLIVKCQSPAGGWRYGPNPGDQDLSVSVMQIVALRAANNAEVPVPAQTIAKAIAYVKSCASPAGGFGYQGPGQGPPTSAAGTLSLQLLGKYDDPNIAKTLDLLAKVPVQWGNNGAQYFYYFHYYAIQAHYQAGGKHWNAWHPKIRELLLQKQNKDGSWDVPNGTAEGANVVDPNKVYWTAMASLVLDIYLHFLPAYQR